ncbi:MAG TPA: hypothetical protein VFX30_08160 [bacterium]|nr:hypothetical protein [bacterium]
MTNVFCPQFPMPIPLGIENESTRTLAHAYNAFGLSRDGALPKALHVGKPLDDSAQHFILYPGGKQVDLTFAATLLNKDRAVLQCFESAIGFDRKHYEANKEAVDQKTPLARFYQDQVLEVWDPILKTKTDGGQAGQAVIYKDLLKFWDDGVGDSNTSTLNLSALMAMLDHIEHPDTYLTVQDLVGQHDKAVGLSVMKGGVVCHAVDWGRTFYKNDQKEYQLVCEKPANLAEMAIAADKNLPAGSWKVTPSDFVSAAAQMKALGLKPAGLKEAGDAFEVTPGTPQGVLDATGYHASHKAVSKTAYYGVPAVLVGVAALIGVGGYLLGLKKARKTGGNGPAGGPEKTPKKPKPASEEKAKPSKSAEAPEKAAAPTKTESKPSTDEGNQFVDEVDKALEEAAANQTPSPGAARKSGDSSPNLVTPDNVLISGSKAEPVGGVDADVIRAQVVLHYRRFLSQAARMALQGGPWIGGDENAVNGAFERELSAITDLIVSDYYAKASSEEGREVLSDLWKSQLEQRGYIVRRGVPQRLLIEIVTDYISEHSSDATSPFAGGVGKEMCAEAERNAGETKFFEDGMRKLMKHSSR